MIKHLFLKKIYIKVRNLTPQNSDMIFNEKEKELLSNYVRSFPVKYSLYLLHRFREFGCIPDYYAAEMVDRLSKTDLSYSQEDLIEKIIKGIQFTNGDIYYIRIVMELNKYNYPFCFFISGDPFNVPVLQ